MNRNPFNGPILNGLYIYGIFPWTLIHRNLSSLLSMILRQSNNLKSSNQWGMTRLKLEDLVLAAQGRLFSALMILMNSLES